MKNPASGRPACSAQVLFSCGDTAASVHLVALDTEGCRLPNLDLATVGQAIELEFLDEVSVCGVVEALEGSNMHVRFVRPVSQALVDYFVVNPATQPRSPWRRHAPLAAHSAAHR